MGPARRLRGIFVTSRNRAQIAAVHDDSALLWSVPDVHVSPAGRKMAAFAVPAERAPVHVLAGVTRAAIRRQLESGWRLRLVAGFANDLSVCSYQRKLRLARMIKAPASPAVRIVAIAATVSEPALVKILVAAAACSRRAFVRWRPVAFLTGNRGMQSDQRKARQLVIERPGASPIGIVVASFASFAEFSFVRIVLPVT